MVGAHQSVVSGLAAVPYNATFCPNASTFQIFIRNNRSGRMRYYYKQEIADFNKSLEENGIQAYVIHAAYTMNPATPDVEKRERYTNMLREDLLLLQQFAGKKYYVLHPGSHLSTDIITGQMYLLEVLKSLEDVVGDVTICIENMAGGGTQILYSLESIGIWLNDAAKIPYLSLCFDTCHAFAQGYDINEFYNIVKPYTSVLHLNNSKGAFGSHVDKHANLKEGLIYYDRLYDIYNDWQLSEPYKPCIIETPNCDSDLSVLLGI